MGKAVREFIHYYHTPSANRLPYEGVIRCAIVIDLMDDDFNSYAIQMGIYSNQRDLTEYYQTLI